MDGITIGEVARRSGLSVSAIRFYQRRGLLPARETGSGWQRYDGATLTRLALIELAKRTGFSLDNVAVLLAALETTESPAATWQAMFQAKINDIDTQMQQLHTMRQLLTQAISCDCLTLETADLIPQALGWATHTATSTRTVANSHQGSSAVTEDSPRPDNPAKVGPTRAVTHHHGRA